MKNIAVVIATKNRPKSLEIALGSILTQTRKPEIILVVSDCDDKHYKDTKKVLCRTSEKIDAQLIKNQRTKNLSGAINTGLDYLLLYEHKPEDTYIAILDDDDIWEDNYLEECLRIAKEEDADWVISGLIRHENEGDCGISLKIPDDLSIDEFYTGNPHIQGSNLFTKFSRMLNAGGYDEALESTTDRDICLRLLELPNIKIAFLKKHLVHHNALPDKTRLSTPGSEKKAKGLIAFYRKYNFRMTNAQRESFKNRAKELFNCEIPHIIPPEQNIEKTSQLSTKNIPIIVGFIATRLDSTRALLNDLLKLNENRENLIHVLITDNTGSTGQLENLVNEKKYKLIDLSLIKANDIHLNSNEGLYGNYLTNEDGRMGVSSGRTVLHHHLYKLARKKPGSVIWILDDDIRLKYSDVYGNEYIIKINQLQAVIQDLIENGINIAIGKITMDPPLPALSIIRTQLLDLHSNIQMFEKNHFEQKNLTSLNALHISKNPDYYYDYSETYFTHLETPIWYNSTIDDGSSQKKMFEELSSIEFGKAVFRPIYVGHQQNKSFLVRGGNTLVTDPECLKNFPNISPRISGLPLRRGDTLWAVLNQQIGGAIIEEFNIPVSQERTEGNQKRLSLNTLLADFYGSAFVKSVNVFYSLKRENGDTISSRLRLELSKDEIHWIIDCFEHNLKRRVTSFRANLYRIHGLIEILEEEHALEVKELITKISEVLNDKDIGVFLSKANSSHQFEIEEFFKSFNDNIKSYREHLPYEITSTQIEHAIERTKKIFGIQDLKYLDHGMEGVILTDGKDAYKYFHNGRLTFRPRQLYFLKETFENRQLEHFVKLNEIYDEAGEVIFRMELFEGKTYSGGHLKEIRALLLECKQKGIIFSNIHPKNLLIKDGQLKICDLGRSIVPLTEPDFIGMVKRAYLTYRYHFRKDLSKLMNLTLFNEKIPELYGFDYFWRSLKEKSKYEVIDHIIINQAKESGGQKILDYGCGHGSIAEPLSEMGFDVTAFDIDEKAIKKNIERNTHVTYLGPEELDNLLNSRKRYDTVICSLVVCTISDEEEASTVLHNIRTLIQEKGDLILAICNPFNTFVCETETHNKQHISMNEYSNIFCYEKNIKETNRMRKETHRPYQKIKELIKKNGFKITLTVETEGVDFNLLAPASDFLILHLKPVRIPSKNDVSLLIKVSPQEWKTIEFQIRHIVNQLDTPKQFSEIVVITDCHQEPFLRQYTELDILKMSRELEELKRLGFIDRIVYTPGDINNIRDTNQKWFGLDTYQTHAANGQNTYMTLFGLDQCKGEYVLQMDSDCIIVRKYTDHDYLSDMMQVFKRDPNAVTVSFNIAREKSLPYTTTDGNFSWRTEVQISLLLKERLNNVLPLPNNLNKDGQFELPWHRAMDQMIISNKWESYRGGDNRTFYIHVLNEMKKDENRWYNILKKAESNNIPSIQNGHVNLQMDIKDWLGTRNEEFVIIVKGKNVKIPIIRRFFESINAQQYDNWGMVIIDAASTNGMEEYLEDIIMDKCENRATFWRNWSTLTPIENIKIAIKELCNNPESVIITLDIDDAFIGGRVLNTLKQKYDCNADLIVGSMIRTDKHKEYLVDFKNPRNESEDNVWQHFRTFEKYHFDNIHDDYFKINGEWISHTEDWAFMLPMVDIAKNPVHIKENLCFYESSKEKSQINIDE